jgi:hypothetical protein
VRHLRQKIRDRKSKRKKRERERERERERQIKEDKWMPRQVKQQSVNT